MSCCVFSLLNYMKSAGACACFLFRRRDSQREFFDRPYGSKCHHDIIVIFNQVKISSLPIDLV